MLKRALNDEKFMEFLANYNKELKRLGKPEINTEDRVLIVSLQDFFNKEMPEDVEGYLKFMEKTIGEN